MNQKSVVGSNGAPVYIAKVAAFEDIEPATGAADGAPEQALSVCAADGRAVTVRGEEAVRNFAWAVEDHLGAEGE